MRRVLGPVLSIAWVVGCGEVDTQSRRTGAAPLVAANAASNSAEGTMNAVLPASQSGEGDTNATGGIPGMEADAQTDDAAAVLLSQCKVEEGERP